MRKESSSSPSEARTTTRYIASGPSSIACTGYSWWRGATSTISDRRGRRWPDMFAVPALMW